MNSRQDRIFLPVPAIILFLFWVYGSALAQPDPAAPSDSSAEPAVTGTVTGAFTVKGGGSMAGGQVLFYTAENNPPFLLQVMRVPSLSGEIMPDGSFSVTLQPGKYYFSAIKRLSGQLLGVPQSGDYWFRLQDENGSTLKELSINPGDTIDLGILEARPKREGRVQFPGTTAINGTLRNMAGDPFENGVVLAYSDPQMQGKKPLFVSNYTGKDGQYTLRVTGDRVYYLMARVVLGGGKLAVGEIIGMHGEGEPTGIAVKNGEAVGEKDIRVSKVKPRNPREQAEAVNTREQTTDDRLDGHQNTAEERADHQNYDAIAAIYGKLTNRKGRPVPNASLLIYTEPDRLGPPLFSAGPSLADGSYSVTFYEEGTYYLAAKLNPAAGSEAEGDSPPGILLGRYGGQVSRPLVIMRNDVKTGIDIVLQPVGQNVWAE